MTICWARNSVSLWIARERIALECGRKNIGHSRITRTGEKQCKNEWVSYKAKVISSEKSVQKARHYCGKTLVKPNRTWGKYVLSGTSTRKQGTGERGRKKGSQWQPITGAENIKPKASSGKYASVCKRRQPQQAREKCNRWITRGKWSQWQAQENKQPIANVKNVSKSAEKLAKAKSRFALDSWK